MITLFLRDIFERSEYRSKLQEKLDDMHRKSNRFIEVHELFSITSEALQNQEKEKLTRDVLIFMKDQSNPLSDWEFFMKILKPMPLVLPTHPTRECHAWKDVGLGFLVVDAQYFKPFVTQLWKKTAYKNKDLLLNNLSAAKFRDVSDFLFANPECRKIAAVHLLQDMLSTTRSFFSRLQKNTNVTSSDYAIEVSSRDEQENPVEAYVLNALVEDHLYTERTITMLVETAWLAVSRHPYPLERKAQFEARLTRMRNKYRFPTNGDGGRDLGRRLIGNVWFGVRFKEAYMREQEMVSRRENPEPMTVSAKVAWGLHA